MLIIAKENYIKEKFDDLEGNPRKFWRMINIISGLGKNRPITGRKCTKLADKKGVDYESRNLPE